VLRDKKVVGVFIAFFRAPLHLNVHFRYKPASEPSVSIM
jgi:hypothetical protein